MRFSTAFLVCLWCGIAINHATSSKMAERLEFIWGKYEEFKWNCSAEERGVRSPEESDYDSSETELGRCLFACIQRRAAILKGGEFSRDVMDRIASFVFQDEPMLKSLAHQVHLRCEKKLTAMKLTDECEIGDRLHLCLQKGWKQAGFKHWSSKGVV